MRGTSRQTTSALIGVFVLLGCSGAAQAQGRAVPVPAPVIAQSDSGFGGMVHNEVGDPIAGVVISIIGYTTTFAVTDGTGRFEAPNLAPGAYLVRAHCRGYLSPRSLTVAVKPRARTASVIAMRRAEEAPTVLAAGLGPLLTDSAPPAEPDESVADTASSSDGDQSETAWRLRHARRGILREVELPGDLALGGDGEDGGSVADFLGRAVSSPARVATNFFAETPFSGQVNLLTANSFDTSDQLLSGGGLTRGIAYLKVGAPVGERADWTVRGALTEGDIASWIVAGDYKTRGQARHMYDIGMSYSTQRYAGGNPLALRDVTENSRNAGTIYGFDTFTIAPALAVTYGARYARYDYLDHSGLFSPRAEVTLKPLHSTRVSVAISSRADAPGAAEFMPPSDEGIWLPPQRTFSSVRPGQPMLAERTTQVDGDIERDFGPTTIGVRAFHQQVNDQMVTIFGAAVPDFPESTLGHYVVGTVGDAEINGGTIAVRSALGSRVHGSIVYTNAVAAMDPARALRYVFLLAPTTIRRGTERIQDVTSSIEAEVPETATRVFVLYRMGTGFARPGDADSQPRVDSRFDIQVRQSLPFLNFTSAKWEMLVAVRNFFRESEADQSLYDELLTVRPPKRIVGGVTLHF